MQIRKWTSHQSGRTREAAIEAMFEDYDRQKGRRRLPSREAFEVYQTRKGKLGGWILYVPRR